MLASPLAIKVWLNCVCPSLRQQVVVVGNSVRHNQQPGHTTLQTVNLRPRAFSVAGPVTWNALPDYL